MNKQPSISPPMQKPVDQCCYCEYELYEGDDVIFDNEGSVYFCDENCLADYIRKHPRYYIDLLLENELFEKITHEK